jgi:hypothetical protein
MTYTLCSSTHHILNSSLHHALHCTTLHYTTLHFNTLHYTHLLLRRARATPYACAPGVAPSPPWPSQLRRGVTLTRGVCERHWASHPRPDHLHPRTRTRVHPRPRWARRTSHPLRGPWWHRCRRRGGVCLRVCEGRTRRGCCYLGPCSCPATAGWSVGCRG